MIETDEVSQEPNPGRRAIRISIAIIVGWVVFVVAVMAVMVAVLGRRQDAKRVETESEAISVATRLTRGQDGLTLGDFVSARFTSESTCRALDPRRVGFSASSGVKLPGDRYAMWLVYVEYRGTLPEPCQRYEADARAFAMVHPRTRAVSPPPDYFVPASDTRPEWLPEFRAGRPSSAPVRAKPKLEYTGSQKGIRATMRLGERVRIPFGPVRSRGGAVSVRGVTYAGPGVGPAGVAMILRSDLASEPRIETGNPAPYPDQEGIDSRQIEPGEEWYVLVTGTPEARQTIRLTEVTFHWSPDDSFEPNMTSYPIDITIVVS